MLSAGEAEDRVSLKLQRDPGVSDLIDPAGEQFLSLCDALIAATKVERDGDRMRLAMILCLSYHLRKIQRVTRAALTLILNGQSAEAMSLVRPQNDFVIAFNYYVKHPDQGQIFMVSQVLLKRNFAKEIMSFDDAIARDPQRLAQLAEIERDVQIAYREFPGLRRPKGKSAKSSSPVLIDWSELSAYDMFSDVMEGLLREHYAKDGKTYSDDEFTKRHERAVKRSYFYRNTFIGQSMHGTAFDVGVVVDIEDDGSIAPAPNRALDSNRLAYHFIANAMPPMANYRDYVFPGEFEAELSALSETWHKLRKECGITADVPEL